MFRAHTSPTILVVDDNEGLRQLFTRILQREGYNVRTALSAATGLREVEDNRPDAIILDLRMSFVDGLEFLRRLRTHDTQTRVAVITGDSSLRVAATSHELETLGAELVCRPFEREDLVTLARRLTSAG